MKKFDDEIKEEQEKIYNSRNNTFKLFEHDYCYINSLKFKNKCSTYGCCGFSNTNNIFKSHRSEKSCPFKTFYHNEEENNKPILNHIRGKIVGRMKNGDFIYQGPRDGLFFITETGKKNYNVGSFLSL